MRKHFSPLDLKTLVAMLVHKEEVSVVIEEDLIVVEVLALEQDLLIVVAQVIVVVLVIVVEVTEVTSEVKQGVNNIHINSQGPASVAKR